MTPEGKIVLMLKRELFHDGGQMRKVSWEGRNNAPDWLCMNNGRGCFVEAKAPGKKPRLGQSIEMEILRDVGGFKCFVIDSTDSIEMVIEYLRGQNE